MKKIIVVALAIFFFVIISVYFGTSTTGLFHLTNEEKQQEYFVDENISETKWKMVGKIEIAQGNVTDLGP